MASTFSPNLRIELIGAGEQAGTWGTTTNRNLGTLLEDAISGYEEVSVISANQALTYADGSADQARNAVIKLTTTTGANFAVYAPPNPKEYTIYNASAHTATIYNSTVIGNTTAAGAALAIPAGKTMTVWSNGTVFSFQNTHLVGTVAGNVTGNLTGNVTGNLTGDVTGNVTGNLTGNVTGNITGVVTATAGSTATTQAFGTNNTTLSTTAFVQAALQALYPVGSVYINAAVSTNPGTLLGFGTWTEFGAGRVLVGLDASDPAFDILEETGGSKTSGSTTPSMSASGTSLSVARDGWGRTGSAPGSITSGRLVVGSGSSEIGETLESIRAAAGDLSLGEHTHTISGGAHTHDTTPPYIVVKMWKRTV